ncbi:hypothetical protein GCM10020331_099570 [Ectobacillus funiculus]
MMNVQARIKLTFGDAYGLAIDSEKKGKGQQLQQFFRLLERSEDRGNGKRSEDSCRKTWKVLIADDEPIIREGIREAINWEALQMEVVAEAEDGEEALELALEHSVDILLADLNMPIMNGITLIKNLREKRPQCKIVIITGHDEFTYAQEAVRLHVTDYILKPANPEQLKNLLKNIRQELEDTIQQNEYLKKWQKHKLQKNFSVAARALFVWNGLKGI